MAWNVVLKVVENEAPTEPVEIDAAVAAQWVRAGEALLVDVRESNEFEKERIPGALLMPLSFLDAEHFPRIPGMKTVLLCAAGKRSAAAGKQLIQAGHPAPWHLKGGLSAWKAAGLAVED